MNKTVRNIVIFGFVTFGCGFLGYAINSLYQPQDPMQSLGVLIWLISPLAANLLLRALSKEGWQDLGILPNLRSGGRWYLAALLIVPIISVVMILIGLLFGTTTLAAASPQGISLFLSLVGVGISGNMVKNLFEEFAWRGYLTPRLEALHTHPFISALVTGVIWASWHIPYYLFFLSPAVLKAQTSLSIPVLILLAFIALPMQALAYAEIRLLSKSVWTTWVLHTIANAISYALVTGGFVIFSTSFFSALLSPGTEGMGYSLLMGLFGWGLHRYRKNSLKAG